jgi:hypothetical protein
MTAEDVYAALHEVVGICGHCGKKKCPGRKQHSQLPGSVSMNQLDRALRIAAKATATNPDGMLERAASK